MRGRSAQPRLAVVWLVGTLAFAIPLAAQPPGLPADEIFDRTQDILDHPGIQTELPGHESFGSGKRIRSDRSRGGGPRATAGGDSRPVASPRPPRSRDPQIPGAAGSFLMWALIGAAMILAISWLVKEASQSRLRVEVKPSVPRPSATEKRPMEPPQIDAIEALAQHGAYGEAVHLLLQRAIAALGRRQRLAPALTSREVLRTVGLTPAAREALREIVAAAELFWFGGRELSRDDYERCAVACRSVLADSAATAGKGIS